jgi:hypothetical protein
MPPTIAVTGVGGIVRQTIDNAQSFLGQVSDDAAPQIINGVIEHIEEPAASGNEFAQSAAINNAGSNYTVGDELVGTGGTFVSPVRIRVDELGGGDSIAKFTIIDAGDYSITPGNPVPFTGGSGSNATFDITWAALSNGGFLNLAQFLDRNAVTGIADKKLVVFWFKVLVGAGVTWNLYVTNGRGLASGSGVEVDNPVDDALVASGTGNKGESVSIEMAPNESLRFVTDAPVTTTKGVFQVHFAPAKDMFGRHFQ